MLSVNEPVHDAYFELAEAIWIDGHDDMTYDHADTLTQLAYLRIRNEGLAAVCLQLLTTRTEIGYGYDSETHEKGYFIGSHFCGAELETVVEYLLSLQIRKQP